jgi:hypothetical protein
MARNKDGSVTLKTTGKTSFTPRGSQVAAATSGPGMGDAQGGRTDRTGHTPVPKNTAKIAVTGTKK